MSRRRRQSLSPTLFPFLAVLVCTLGTLILLLALVARNTSQAAQQIAELPPEVVETSDQLTVGDVEQLVEEEEFRLGELVSFREAQTADLENRRDRLAHVEDHMRRIREQLREISAAMEQAMSDRPSPSMTNDELVKLKEQLTKEELVVKKLRDEIKNEKPRFVIVPHQGPNGTTRRPIYVECTPKGVTIWPEGIEITKWQLEKSSTEANPLDDALRAARYHAIREYGDQIPPYPMLLVRPGGVDTYYAARAAMKDWDDQFGYELVPADIRLAYPNPDPVMRQRMQYAVDQAVERVTRFSIVRSVVGGGSRYPGGPGGNPGSVGRRSGDPRSGSGRATTRGAGSFPGANGYSNQAAAQSPPRPKKMPRLSVAEMDRRGRQSGFRDHRTFPTRSYAPPSGSGSSISADDAKRRLEQQLASSAGSFDSEAGDQSIGQAARTAVDQIGQPGATGSGQAQASRMQAGNDANESANGLSPHSVDMTEPNRSVAGMNASASNDQSERRSRGPAGNSEDGQMRQSRSGANASTKNNPGAFGPSAGAMAGMNQPQQSVSQQRRLTAPENAAAAGTPPPGANPNSGSPNQRRRESSTVRRSGADWALPRGVALGRGNEIVRSIRVQVHQDRFVIMPSASTRASETFSIVSDGVDRATLEMATALRDRVERWGAAAPGARWSPRLLVDVMPGAEARFSELEKLMSGSGLPVVRSDYRQADSNPEGNAR